VGVGARKRMPMQNYTSLSIQPIYKIHHHLSRRLHLVLQDKPLYPSITEVGMIRAIRRSGRNSIIGRV